MNETPRPERAIVETYFNGHPRRCIYPCQKRDSNGAKIARTCSVSVDPNYNGNKWSFTGPLDAPTLSPSIDCDSKPCWHGHIIDGEVRR